MDKRSIILENGASAVASCPVIVSASRSTDIPAFYADWFFHRLKVGYSVWTNPFNKAQSYISYEDTRFIVFWSKNPRPLLPYLEILEEKGIGQSQPASATLRNIFEKAFSRCLEI